MIGLDVLGASIMDAVTSIFPVAKVLTYGSESSAGSRPAKDAAPDPRLQAAFAAQREAEARAKAAEERASRWRLYLIACGGAAAVAAVAGFVTFGRRRD